VRLSSVLTVLCGAGAEALVQGEPLEDDTPCSDSLSWGLRLPGPGRALLRRHQRCCSAACHAHTTGFESGILAAAAITMPAWQRCRPTVRRRGDGRCSEKLLSRCLRQKPDGRGQPFALCDFTAFRDKTTSGRAATHDVSVRTAAVTLDFDRMRSALCIQPYRGCIIRVMGRRNVWLKINDGRWGR
jgi:hypothetical protein